MKKGIIAHKLLLKHGSIELGHNVTTALFDQDQEKVLDPKKTIYQEICDACPNVEESKIRAVLGAFLFSGDDVHKLTKVLSGGERNRVAMAKIILSKANFFLLDEPTNHLDIESKEVILRALKNFEGTILFVSHDQDFVNRLATKIIELHENGVTLYPGDYDSYLAVKDSVGKNRDENLIGAKKASLPSQVAFVKGESKKELYELQKKVKNLNNRIVQIEQKKPEILNQMGLAVYGSAEYVKLHEELLRSDKILQAAIKERDELSKKINKE